MTFRLPPFAFRLCLGLALALPAAAPLALSGCATPVNQRVVAGQTLKATGQAAEAAVALSAQLYAEGRLSPAVARAVLDFYNDRWQPAYRLALTAAQADPATPAPTQLLALLAQLQGMVSLPAPKPAAP